MALTLARVVDEEGKHVEVGSQSLQLIVVPLLKDTFAKGHLSNKDRIIF